MTFSNVKVVSIFTDEALFTSETVQISSKKNIVLFIVNVISYIVGYSAMTLC